MNKHQKDRKEALEYRAIAEGYDGRMIIDQLNLHLKPGAQILEVGMGPGKDLEILSEKYKVTGSDFSVAFLDLYREKNPGADLLQLDALTLNTDRTFDCIYSNKVLHQLSRTDLKQSFKRQLELLNPGGLLCHSFWYGDKTVEHRGAKFEYYTENTITDYFAKPIKLIYFKKYMEMVADDSIFFIFSVSE